MLLGPTKEGMMELSFGLLLPLNLHLLKPQLLREPEVLGRHSWYLPLQVLLGLIERLA
jgi:hypothetical protein